MVGPMNDSLRSFSVELPSRTFTQESAGSPVYCTPVRQATLGRSDETCLVYHMQWQTILPLAEHQNWLKLVVKSGLRGNEVVSWHDACHGSLTVQGEWTAELWLLPWLAPADGAFNFPVNGSKTVLTFGPAIGLPDKNQLTMVTGFGDTDNGLTRVPIEVTRGRSRVTMIPSGGIVAPKARLRFASEMAEWFDVDANAKTIIPSFGAHSVQITPSLDAYQRLVFE